MHVKYENLIRYQGGTLIERDFSFYEATAATKIRAHWTGAGVLQSLAVHDEAAAIAANDEFDSTHQCPRACIYASGKLHTAMFMNDNYLDIRQESQSRGLVHRVRNRISQHLCAPILDCAAQTLCCV